MLAESLPQIGENKLSLDHIVDDETDNRRGLTLLIRPNAVVKKNIAEMLQEFATIEPNQYCYPISDMHITVMSIVTCYAGFNIEKVSKGDYIKVVEESLGNIGKFKIAMKGLTTAQSGVLVKGFPTGFNLEKLRNNLRENFAKSHLENSLDGRYKIQTAHSTTMRFKKPLQNIKGFLKLFEKYKEFDFGTFEIGEYELVFNDWYQRQQNTIEIKRITQK